MRSFGEGLGKISGLAVDSHGVVYVCYAENGCIHLF